MNDFDIKTLAEEIWRVILNSRDKTGYQEIDYIVLAITQAAKRGYKAESE